MTGAARQTGLILGHWPLPQAQGREQGDAKGLPTKERPCPGLQGAAEPTCHRQPLPCPSLNGLWHSRAGDFYPLPQSQMLAGSKRHPEMEVGGALKREGAPCSMQEAEPQRPWVVDMSEHCARLFQGPAGVAVTLVCSAAQGDCGPPPARLPCLHMRDTEVRGDGSRGRPGTATGVLGFRGEGGAAGGLVALLAMLEATPPGSCSPLYPGPALASTPQLRDPQAWLSRGRGKDEVVGLGFQREPRGKSHTQRGL